MIDIFHYFFEEDHRFISGEQADAVDNMRSALYSNFYNKSYRYNRNTSSSRRYNYTDASGNYSGDYTGTDVDDPMGEKPPTKPYVPATNFDPESVTPFGFEVDPPLG